MKHGMTMVIKKPSLKQETVHSIKMFLVGYKRGDESFHRRVKYDPDVELM
jgi:hypothetical protein